MTNLSALAEKVEGRDPASDDLNKRHQEMLRAEAEWLKRPAKTAAFLRAKGEQNG